MIPISLVLLLVLIYLLIDQKTYLRLHSVLHAMKRFSVAIWRWLHRTRIPAAASKTPSPSALAKGKSPAKNKSPSDEEEEKRGGGQGQEREPRKRITDLSRRMIGAKQRWSCKHCARLLDAAFEIDHIIPLFKNGTNDESNLQALCRNCHGLKTLKEKQKSATVTTSSSTTAATKKPATHSRKRASRKKRT